MKVKNTIKKIIAIMLCFIILSSVLVINTGITASAEDVLSWSYDNKGTPSVNDDTLFFNSGVSTASNGTVILQALGYFITIYDINKEEVGTVFLTNSVNGRAYYSYNGAGQNDGIKIPVIDIINKIYSEHPDKIGENMRNCLNSTFYMVLDTLLTISKKGEDGSYCAYKLRDTNVTTGEIITAYCNFLNDPTGTANGSDFWAPLGIQRNYGSPLYSGSYFELAMSSGVFANSTRISQIGFLPSFSSYLYYIQWDGANGNGHKGHADDGSNFIQAYDFSSETKSAAPVGYFAIPAGKGDGSPIVNTKPITVRPGTANDATGIRIFKDAARTQEETGRLMEGVPYYPRYYFYNSSSSPVACWLEYRNHVTHSNPEENYSTEAWFAGETYLDGPEFTIDSSKQGCPSDYSYATAIAELSSAMTLLSTDSYVDNNPYDDTYTLRRQYIIINPEITQYFNDNATDKTVDGYELIVNSVTNKKVYSGENIEAYPVYKNASSFKGTFWYTWQLVPDYIGQSTNFTETMTPSVNNPRGYVLNGDFWVKSGDIWTNTHLYTRAKNTGNKNTVLRFDTSAGEISHLFETNDWNLMRTTKDTDYEVHPTDLKATKIQFIDFKTGKEVTSVKQNQEIVVRYTFENATDLPVYAKIHCEQNNNASEYACSSFGSDNYIEKNIVIGANSKASFDSEPFKVDAKNHSKINASSAIYLYDMWKDASYETNGENNEMTYKSSKDGQDGIDIESPFISELVNKNSEYRRGKTVVTSFNIKNNSDNFIVGNMEQINNGDILNSNIKIYDDSSVLLYEFNKEFVINKDSNTLVWFKWTVPEALDNNKVHIVFTADNLNNYSSENFSEGEGKDILFKKVLNIDIGLENEIYSVTPDTSYTESKAYWYTGNGTSKKKNTLYASKAQFITETSWSYWVNKYYPSTDSYEVELKIETASLANSKVNIKPTGNKSSYYDSDSGKWIMKSGYGYDINTDFVNIESEDCVNTQTTYCTFPEFMYKITNTDFDDESYGVMSFFNSSGKRVGYDNVKNGSSFLTPENGVKFGTFTSLSSYGNNSFKLPYSNKYKSNIHFIPIWFSDSDYSITCYTADCWTPGGMLSSAIVSNKIKISGNMYDDYYVSIK